MGVRSASRLDSLRSTGTKAAQAGFNFLSLGKNIGMSGTGQGSSFSPPSVGSNTSSGASATITNPMQLFLFNQGLNVGATVEDLEQKNILQILAEPSISALSGHRASFLSGGPVSVSDGAAERWWCGIGGQLSSCRMV